MSGTKPMSTTKVVRPVQVGHPPVDGAAIRTVAGRLTALQGNPFGDGAAWRGDQVVPRNGKLCTLTSV